MACVFIQSAGSSPQNVIHSPNVMRRFFLIGFLLVLTGPTLSLAQVQDAALETGSDQAVSLVPVQIDLDHAAFALEAGSSLVEFYMSFEAATLHYEATDQGFLAELPVSMNVVRSTQTAMMNSPEEPVWSDELNLSFIMADTTGMAEGQHFVHQVRAAIPPGSTSYVCRSQRTRQWIAWVWRCAGM